MPLRLNFLINVSAKGLIRPLASAVGLIRLWPEKKAMPIYLTFKKLCRIGIDSHFFFS
ncbi:MAG: hypothetical protein AAB019_02430 [Planctomycetota bacterium]